MIDYINTQRVKRAAQQLTTTDRSISEVAEEMGILDVNYFAKIFKRTFGMTPTRYRRENRKSKKSTIPARKCSTSPSVFHARIASVKEDAKP